jgi:hypothetical protein
MAGEARRPSQRVVARPVILFELRGKTLLSARSDNRTSLSQCRRNCKKKPRISSDSRSVLTLIPGGECPVCFRPVRQRFVRHLRRDCPTGSAAGVGCVPDAPMCWRHLNGASRDHCCKHVDDPRTRVGGSQIGVFLRFCDPRGLARIGKATDDSIVRSSGMLQKQALCHTERCLQQWSRDAPYAT